MLIIEMNPRVSRSSALASKATGFPIAKVAAKLAVGYTLDELRNEITGGATPASFEPTIDYVVTKVPRFAFEKFPQADDRLTTQMKSVGEVMAIGRTFQESFQKALRGLEVGVDGLNQRTRDRETIETELGDPGPERIWYVGDAFENGFTLEEVHELTHIDPWFLAQIKEIVDIEMELDDRKLADIDARDAARAQAQGVLRPAARASLQDHGAGGARAAPRIRHPAGLQARGHLRRRVRHRHRVHVLDLRGGVRGPAHQSRSKVMVLGGGPNRIGQGIEFDYCCVHAALALREDGFETIMVNCNPETVSTDYDTSDRLYFEPLTLEDVLEIVHVEKPVRRDRAVRRPDAAQARARPGGERRAHHRHHARLDRHRRGPRALPEAAQRLKLKQPPNRTARSPQQALAVAEEIGYPLVVRPSYVLGGRAMEIVYQQERPRALHARGGEGEQRQPGAARPLPERRDRSRRRRGVRRQGGGDRRHHGAHRAGGRAFRRFGVLAAAVLPVARSCRTSCSARPSPWRMRSRWSGS